MSPAPEPAPARMKITVHALALAALWGAAVAQWTGLVCAGQAAALTARAVQEHAEGAAPYATSPARQRGHDYAVAADVLAPLALCLAIGGVVAWIAASRRAARVRWGAVIALVVYVLGWLIIV